MKRKISLTLSVFFYMGQTFLTPKDCLLKEVDEMLQEAGEDQSLY